MGEVGDVSRVLVTECDAEGTGETSYQRREKTTEVHLLRYRPLGVP